MLLEFLYYLYSSVFMCLFRVNFVALVAFLGEPGLWEWWWMCWWLWWLCRSPLTPASSEPITHRFLVSALPAPRAGESRQVAPSAAELPCRYIRQQHQRGKEEKRGPELPCRLTYIRQQHQPPPAGNGGENIEKLWKARMAGRKNATKDGCITVNKMTHLISSKWYG